MKLAVWLEEAVRVRREGATVDSRTGGAETRSDSLSPRPQGERGALDLHRDRSSCVSDRREVKRSGHRLRRVNGHSGFIAVDCHAPVTPGHAPCRDDLRYLVQPLGECIIPGRHPIGLPQPGLVQPNTAPALRPDAIVCSVRRQCRIRNAPLSVWHFTWNSRAGYAQPDHAETSVPRCSHECLSGQKEGSEPVQS
jgi:hypothetical protein